MNKNFVMLIVAVFCFLGFLGGGIAIESMLWDAVAGHSFASKLDAAFVCMFVGSAFVISLCIIGFGIMLAWDSWKNSK